MFDINTILTLTLLIFSWAIIVSFALVIYGVFRMQDPPLSPFQTALSRLNTGHRPLMLPSLRKRIAR